MVGNRTAIVAIVSWIGAAAARYGYNVDAEIVADVVINGMPLLMLLMRAITRTPIGKPT